MASSTPLPSSNLDITIGLEIEFDLAVLPATYADPHRGHDRLVYEPIRQPGAEGFKYPETDAWYNTEDHRLFEVWGGLWSHNAKLHIANYLEEHGFRACVTEYNAQYQPVERWSFEDKFRHKIWKVADKQSLHPPGYRHGYFMLPMELQSPPLRFSEISLEQVRHVLKLISERYMVFCDLDTSIHIHIGNSGREFPLETAINFSLLAFTFEQQILRVHPPRFQNYHGHEVLYPPLINRLSNVSALAAVKHHNTPVFALETIAACKSLDELVFYAKSTISPHRLTYNLLGLSDMFRTEAPHDADPFKQTAEFRQHNSHFEGEEVTHWITICAAFLRKAHGKSTADILEMCRYMVTQYPGDYSLEENRWDRAIAYGPINRDEQMNYPGWSIDELQGGPENRPRLPPRDPGARILSLSLRLGPSYPEQDYVEKEQ
ncbi:hypothetical protein ACMFMF_010393 [Clarireedia jacksonii]